MAELDVTVVAGARPNFVKVAPLLRAFAAQGIQARLVNAGQHTSPAMAGDLLRELGMPVPDADLRVGPGTHAEQTARGLLAFEREFLDSRPGAVVVVGDVNTTLTAALTAAKLSIPIAHVEAGLRSGDRSMPEEINRILTDHLSEWLFTTSSDADENLAREGIGSDAVHLVGNTMVDTLLHSLPSALPRVSTVRERLSLPGDFGVVTLHRPSNVDSARRLDALLGLIGDVARDLPMVFSVHPRTQVALERRGKGLPTGVVSAPPLSYLDFLALLSQARLVLTDSGGVQEETSVLGVPCITVRDTTERPITCTAGTNAILGPDPTLLPAMAREVLGRPGNPARPEIPLWDGHAAERIAALLASDLGSRNVEPLGDRR